MTCPVRTSSSICGAFVAHAFATPSLCSHPHRAPASPVLRGCASVLELGKRGGAFASLPREASRQMIVIICTCTQYRRRTGMPRRVPPAHFFSTIARMVVSFPLADRGASRVAIVARGPAPWTPVAAASCCDIQLCFAHSVRRALRVHVCLAVWLGRRVQTGAGVRRTRAGFRCAPMTHS